MKERPVLFSGAMVRAILEGRKTQTRRAVKDLALEWLSDFTPEFVALPENGMCHYGEPGDRLWVRETWWEVPEPSLRQLRDGADTWPKIAYDADESEITREQNKRMGWRKRPSIFLPRRASRIALEITDVRVERVQDISEADAKAEGLEGWSLLAKEIADIQISDESPDMKELARLLGPGEMPAKAEFQMLWDSRYAKRGFGWDENPWMWVISFKRVDAAERAA